MFDIGLSELIVIGLVALIVIGPERLPRVARTAGALLGRFQRYVNDIKSEVRREMEIDDLKKFQEQLTEQVQEVGQTIHGGLRSAEDVARTSLTEAEKALAIESLGVSEPVLKPVLTDAVATEPPSPESNPASRTT